MRISKLLRAYSLRSVHQFVHAKQQQYSAEHAPSAVHAATATTLAAIVRLPLLIDCQHTYIAQLIVPIYQTLGW
jgi:hypothetical protein